MADRPDPTFSLPTAPVTPANLPSGQYSLLSNPGSQVQYNPQNPFNVGVQGTGDYTGGRNLNSSLLAPTSSFNYSTPQQTPIPSVDGLDASGGTTLTQPEKTASDLSTKLEGLNNSLVGKSQATTDAENAAGIPDLQKRQSDLSTQLKQLQNEALAIPQQLQIDSTGRGITAAGLAPQQTGRLRTNAIAALGVSSLLDSTNGLISSAQTKVDRAVKAKYDPIQEQIDAATKNLQIILNSPEYTNAEKNRAQAQLDIQNKKAEALAKNKQDSSTIQSWAAAAIANGATPLQAQEIMKIGQSDKPDLNVAFKLYAPFAKDPVATQKALLDLQLTRSQINKNNADAQKSANDQKIQNATNVDIPSLIGSIKNLDQTQSSLGGLTVNGLTQKAKTYMANGGNIQGLGLSNSGSSGIQRTLIANYAGYLASQAGMDIPQITALYKANSKAAGEVISRIAKIDTTSNTLAGQFPRLAQLAQKVGNLGITESDLTKGKAEVARKFGSVDAGNYVELIQTIRGDYAAMQAAVGGSRGGEFFARNAQDAIPLGLTPEQYLGLADTIRTSAAIAQQSSGDEAKKLIGVTTPTTSSSTDQIVNGVTYTLGPDGLYYKK